MLEVPLTGVWVYSRANDTYRCTRCGQTVPGASVDDYKQCPKCKAYMRKSS